VTIGLMGDILGLAGSSGIVCILVLEFRPRPVMHCLKV